MYGGGEGNGHHGDIVGVMSTGDTLDQLRKVSRHGRMVLHTILALPFSLVAVLLSWFLIWLTDVSFIDTLPLVSLVIIPLYMIQSVTYQQQKILLATCVGKGVPVELIDFEGDRYYTIARPIGNGSMEAFVRWGEETGYVRLRSDGTIGPEHAIIMYFWLPLRKRDRFEHMLYNDTPDFDQLVGLDLPAKRKIMNDLAHWHKSGLYTT